MRTSRLPTISYGIPGLMSTNRTYPLVIYHPKTHPFPRRGPGTRDTHSLKGHGIRDTHTTMDRMTNRHPWKHYLPPISLAGGNYINIVTKCEWSQKLNNFVVRNWLHGYQCHCSLLTTIIFVVKCEHPNKLPCNPFMMTKIFKVISLSANGLKIDNFHVQVPLISHPWWSSKCKPH